MLVVLFLVVVSQLAQGHCDASVGFLMFIFTGVAYQVRGEAFGAILSHLPGTPQRQDHCVILQNSVL